MEVQTHGGPLYPGQKPKVGIFAVIDAFYHSRAKYWVIGIVLVLFFIFFRRYLFLAVLGAMVMGLDYIILSLRLPIHLDIQFFVAFMIAHVFGFPATIVFVLVTSNVAEALTGVVEVADLIAEIPLIALIGISLLFQGASPVVGIIFLLLYCLSTFMINSMLGEEEAKAMFEPALNFLLNFILFLNLTGLLITLMK